MKKYVKPLMEGQLFVANEYIGACGDHEYKIYCNVPGYGSLYKESNGIEGLQTKDGRTAAGERYSADTYLVSGIACGKWHSAVLDFDPTDSDNTNGYWVRNGQTMNVYVFNEKGKGTSDWHGSIGGPDNIVNAS